MPESEADSSRHGNRRTTMTKFLGRSTLLAMVETHEIPMVPVTLVFRLRTHTHPPLLKVSTRLTWRMHHLHMDLAIRHMTQWDFLHGPEFHRAFLLMIQYQGILHQVIPLLHGQVMNQCTHTRVSILVRVTNMAGQALATQSPTPGRTSPEWNLARLVNTARARGRTPGISDPSLVTQ